MNKIKAEAEKKAQIISNHYNAGSYEIAIANAKKLLKKFPNFLFLYNIIGLSLHAKKEFIESIYYFEKALKIDSKNISALNNLGLSYRYMGNLEDAKKYFEKALKRDSNFISATVNLANTLKDLNQVNDAINLYKKAINLDSSLFLVHYNLGLTYQSIGDFKNSNEYFFSCLKINPNFTMADKQLSMSTTYNPQHKHLKEMENKIYNKNLNEIEKINLNFAIGKAYDDCANYNNAYKFFEKGNDLKRKNINFDINNEKQKFTQIKKFFSNNNLNKKPINIDNKLKMIFIVGMPRSGTTLIEQIISSHKKVYGGGERNELENLSKINFIKTNNLNDTNSLELLNKSFFENIKKNTKIENQIFITDKNPTNFKWIGIIKLLFPKSKVIHCKRDDKDTCLSIYNNLFLSNWGWCYQTNELATYYKMYLDLMKFWKVKFSDFIYDISYENLVNNKEDEIKKLLNFCKLDMDKNCLDFQNNKKPVITMSVAQVRKPIYKSSIKSWKNYEKYLKNLFDNL